MENVKQYIESKDWEYREESAGEEIVCKVCPICNNNDWHFYININTGLYQCWICSSDNEKGKGHISKLKTYMGDILSVAPPVSQIDTPDPDFSNEVAANHNSLLTSRPATKYLLKRGITLDVVKQFKLGLTTKHNQEVISIPSFENGIPKLIKYRKFGKDTNPKLSRYLRKKNSKSILFNGDVITNNPEYIILTEGEIDALTLLSKGFTNVVGTTGGAGTLLPEWYDKLINLPKIYVCYDNDEVGNKAVKEVLAKRLGFGRIYKVELPEFAKDINDLFTTEPGFNFEELLTKAKPFKIPGILSISDSLEEVYQSAVEGRDELIKTPWPQVNRLFNGGLRQGNLIVLGAPPKIGKTTLSLQIALEAALEGIPALFFCLEMPFKELALLAVCMNQRISEREFDPMSAAIYARGFRDVPLYMGYSPNPSIQQISETFKEVQNRYGIKLAVFDNLQWLVRSADKVKEETGMATQLFKNLAINMDIPIILIVQPRKLKISKTQEPMNYWDYRDSSSIPADADVCCVMHRNRLMGSTTDAFDTETIFRIDAGRLTRGGQTTLTMKGDEHRFVEEDNNA